MRSLLKDNSTALDFTLRLVDPLFIVAIMYVCYRIYLGNWNPPAH